MLAAGELGARRSGGGSLGLTPECHVSGLLSNTRSFCGIRNVALSACL